ncbi:unnamed protein product [Calicophoron daubneyi]|uniref:Uncharacterized protein n=1 Tax=Calicophoron daubneyi TaxID=300641 RepID=A0AAV2T3Z8_CALDB
MEMARTTEETLKQLHFLLLLAREQMNMSNRNAEGLNTANGEHGEPTRIHNKTASGRRAKIVVRPLTEHEPINVLAQWISVASESRSETKPSVPSRKPCDDRNMVGTPIRSGAVATTICGARTEGGVWRESVSDVGIRTNETSEGDRGLPRERNVSNYKSRAQEQLGINVQVRVKYGTENRTASREMKRFLDSHAEYDDGRIRIATFATGTLLSKSPEIWPIASSALWGFGQTIISTSQMPGEGLVPSALPEVLNLLTEETVSRSSDGQSEFPEFVPPDNLTRSPPRTRLESSVAVTHSPSADEEVQPEPSSYLDRQADSPPEFWSAGGTSDHVTSDSFQISEAESMNEMGRSDVSKSDTHGSNYVIASTVLMGTSTMRPGVISEHPIIWSALRSFGQVVGQSSYELAGEVIEEFIYPEIELQWLERAKSDSEREQLMGITCPKIDLRDSEKSESDLEDADLVFVHSTDLGPPGSRKMRNRFESSRVKDVSHENLQPNYAKHTPCGPEDNTQNQAGQTIKFVPGEEAVFGSHVRVVGGNPKLNRMIQPTVVNTTHIKVEEAVQLLPGQETLAGSFVQAARQRSEFGRVVRSVTIPQASQTNSENGFDAEITELLRSFLANLTQSRNEQSKVSVAVQTSLVASTTEVSTLTTITDRSHVGSEISGVGLMKPGMYDCAKNAVISGIPRPKKNNMYKKLLRKSVRNSVSEVTTRIPRLSRNYHVCAPVLRTGSVKLNATFTSGQIPPSHFQISVERTPTERKTEEYSLYGVKHPRGPQCKNQVPNTAVMGSVGQEGDPIPIPNEQSGEGISTYEPASPTHSVRKYAYKTNPATSSTKPSAERAKFGTHRSLVNFTLPDKVGEKELKPSASVQVSVDVYTASDTVDGVLGSSPTAAVPHPSSQKPNIVRSCGSSVSVSVGVGSLFFDHTPGTSVGDRPNSPPLVFTNLEDNGPLELTVNSTQRELLVEASYAERGNKIMSPEIVSRSSNSVTEVSSQKFSPQTEHSLTGVTADFQIESQTALNGIASPDLMRSQFTETAGLKPILEQASEHRKGSLTEWNAVEQRMESTSSMQRVSTDDINPGLSVQNTDEDSQMPDVVASTLKSRIPRPVPLDVSQASGSQTPAKESLKSQEKTGSCIPLPKCSHPPKKSGSETTSVDSKESLKSQEKTGSCIPLPKCSHPPKKSGSETTSVDSKKMAKSPDKGMIFSPIEKVSVQGQRNVSETAGGDSSKRTSQDTLSINPPPRDAMPKSATHLSYSSKKQVDVVDDNTRDSLASRDIKKPTRSPESRKLKDSPKPKEFIKSQDSGGHRESRLPKKSKPSVDFSESKPVEASRNSGSNSSDSTLSKPSSDANVIQVNEEVTCSPACVQTTCFHYGSPPPYCAPYICSGHPPFPPIGDSPFGVPHILNYRSPGPGCGNAWPPAQTCSTTRQQFCIPQSHSPCAVLPHAAYYGGEPCEYKCYPVQPHYSPNIMSAVLPGRPFLSPCTTYRKCTIRSTSPKQAIDSTVADGAQGNYTVKTVYSGTMFQTVSGMPPAHPSSGRRKRALNKRNRGR